MADAVAGGGSGDGMAAPSVVPDWLANLAALSWRVLAIAGLAVALWLTATVLWTVTASIAVAVVIAAAFAPAVLRLRARGRSRTAASAIVWVVAIAAIAGILLLLGLALLPYAAEIVRNVTQGITDLQARLADISAPPFVGHLVDDLVNAVRGMLASAGSAVVSAAASVGTILVLATFLVFFFLRDGDTAWAWAFQAFSDAKQASITASGRDAVARIGGYLRGTTVLSGLIAITDFVFMIVLGVPLAAPLSVLVFLGGYIPYFGGAVTTGLVLLVALAAVGPWPTLVLLLLIAIRNVILGYGIRPALYGRTVSIHPALVLIALPAGYQLAGIVGLFAAVPVTAVLFAVATSVLELVEPDRRPRLPGLVPAWLDRVAQWSWRLLAALALAALVVSAFVAVPLVLLPVVLSVILAATLDPLVKVLERRGQSRARAAAVATGGGFLAVAVIMILTIATLVDQVGPMMTGVESGADAADAALGGQLGLLVTAVTTGGGSIAAGVADTIQALSTVVVIVILSTLLAFYFLRDGGRLWGRIVHRVRPDVEPDVHSAGSRAYEILGGYMAGTAVVSFVGAFSQMVIMILLGLPLALPVFVLSFVLCFIPYIGGFISTGIALLIAISVGDPTTVLIMAIWTLVFNLVTGNIVSPIVYGKTVHLHPAVVLVAIPAAGAVAGILGMFLVVPLAGVVATTWRTVVRVMGARPQGADGEPGAGPDAAVITPIT
jgi:putative heme transporter